MKARKSKMAKTFGREEGRNGALCVLVVTLGLVCPSRAATDVWTSKANMPTARYVLGTCAVEGKIYAIGGALSHHVATSVVEVYDPATDTWERKASMPKVVGGPIVAAVDGKIYAIGGLLSLRSTYEYDPGTDVWTRKADMPTGRWALSGSVVNGKIYAIGGAPVEDGPGIKTVEEYDPATDTWTRKADLPEARYFHAAAVVDGKIYVIAGGPQAYVETAAMYAYDPAADTWARKADAPTARAMASASTLHGRIYVIGGFFAVNRTMYLAGAGSSPYRASVEEYDPATDTWTIRADLPTPRGNLSTIALNDKIYAIGGMKTWWDPFATVEEYDPYPLVVDFNGDGIVDTKDLLQLIESWGQADPNVDIAPRPLGDGIIDEKDLELLMSHWSEEPGLIAKWKLDETSGTTAAESVAANDGALVGEPLWQPAGGKMAGALQFDGLDDCVETSFVLDPSAGPFSVFAWVRGGAPGQVLLSQAGGANWLMLTPEGALATELKQAGRSGKPLTFAAVLTDGAWHHAALVWDGTSRILYVDEVEVARDTQTSLPLVLTGLYIGAGKGLEPNTFWSGLIDDVRIYNRVVRP